MSGQNKNQYVLDASLSNLEIISPQLSVCVLSAVSSENHPIRESPIHQYSTSVAEFTAAREMADNFSLVVH